MDGAGDGYSVLGSELGEGDEVRGDEGGSVLRMGRVGNCWDNAMMVSFFAPARKLAWQCSTTSKVSTIVNDSTLRLAIAALSSLSTHSLYLFADSTKPG